MNNFHGQSRYQEKPCMFFVGYPLWWCSVRGVRMQREVEGGSWGAGGHWEAINGSDLGQFLKINVTWIHGEQREGFLY